MKKQMVGIALILLGIIFAIPVLNGVAFSWYIGVALGVLGVIIVIATSGQDQEK